jgi:hypothetical protein
LHLGIFDQPGKKEFFNRLKELDKIDPVHYIQL